jgi:hypothetical protein
MSRRLNNAYRRILQILSDERLAPLILFFICLASYLPGIRHMGFFWDDWPINWMAQNLGNQGLATYFSTNRPVWGLLYQATTPLLGSNPLVWQVAAILARFLTGMAAWVLVRQVWPGAKQAALWTGLLFLVYPGFTQQHVALLYTHFFLVITFFLLSLTCTAAALRQPRRFWLFTILGLLLSVANLLMMEYFFMLDLLRPLLIWIVLGAQVGAAISGWKLRLWRTLKLWAPYAAVFVLAAVWRAFLFPYTQENYQLSFVDQLKAQPLAAIGGLISRALSQIWTASAAAWGQVMHLPNSDSVAAAGSLVRYLALFFVVLAFLGVALWQQRPATPQRAGRWGWQALVVGGAALLLAGWPFWLTDVPFSLNFAYNRFTLPFMLGVSLVLAGIVDLLPLWHGLKAGILAILVTMGVGWQVQAATSYVNDWQMQEGFFQQITWRVPGLKPGTIILANEMPIHPTDNSLTAPINWIYAPGNPGPNLPYLMVYPTIRLGSQTLPALEKGQPVTKDYLVATFRGNTDQAIAVYYNPPACLRLLTIPDGNDPWLPRLSKSMAVLSDPGLILDQGPDGPAQLMAGIFPAARSGTWCEYYEKADLAAQRGDWAEVGRLASLAGDLTKQANSPVELYPFIEGYAHLGAWDKVNQLSRFVAPKPDSDLAGRVCQLLSRIQSSTPDNNTKVTTLKGLDQDLECNLTSIN